MRDVAKCVTCPVVMLIFCVVFLRASGERNGNVCSSVDVRNDPSSLYDKLHGCVVVEGSVRIVLQERAVESNFANVSFPELREITQYLLVYRVTGLRSLGQLFPNLALIRGTKLFINGALVIYENAMLQEVGLRSLTHILEGSVIIHKNYNLCFATSIDWGVIMKSNNTNETYYDVMIGQNKDSKNECHNKDVCKAAGCERGLCWSKSHCQILHMDCHPLCAGGCYEPNNPDECYTCKGLLTSENKCVASCPQGTYEYLRRTCLSESECRNKTLQNKKDKSEIIRFLPFNGSCINECPSQYQKDEKNETCISCEKTLCRKDCVAPTGENESLGTFRITSISETLVLTSCTHIYGTLAIDGLNGNYNSGMERVLERDLGMIEEISGQLKIIHSHALVSLNFLRNLRTINGEHANSSYDLGMADELTHQTLVVKDNKNLQKLWDWDRQPFKDRGLQIKSGKILFHYNPKLCLSEIDKLVQVAKLPPVSNLEVSRESNGDQTVCNAVPFKVTVEKTAPNSVILALHMSSNISSAGRFMVFYKESSGIPLNQSMQYETVSECGDDQWKVTSDAEPNTTNGTHYIFLPQLEPAVQYVFFVRSLHSTIGTSPVQTVTTLSAQPSIPLDLKVNYTTNSSIVLNWRAPLHPHGKLKHYIVRGYYQTDRLDSVMERDYCVNKLKNEILTWKPVISTTPPPTNANGTCQCNVTAEKNNEESCSVLEHDSVDSARTELGTQMCDMFIYRLIDSKSQMLKSVNNHQPKEFIEQDSTYNTYPSKTERASDGLYDTFWHTVDANTTAITLNNLHHFSQYVIMVAACPDPETDVPCSRDAILTVRTEPSAFADRIDGSKVKIASFNQTTQVVWEEPTFVNSFVHSYTLAYRSKDVENAKFEDRCVTTKRFHEANNTYLLQNLPIGHYELRLRAISLFGDGPYYVTSFEIEEPNRSRVSIFMTGVVIIMVVGISIVVILYYWRAQLNKNRILFASVNPRYEPVYVEDHWEVPRENLTLVKQLGRGIFGSVHEGILQPDQIRCAVKTTTSISEEDNMTFLKEATIMKEFHKAYHIVKLIGVISKGSPVYVIMELMNQGDLKTFLLRSGSQFCDDTRTLPATMLLKMAAQIADGMAFLEAKKFVHRDLAARNCMVGSDNTIKIGDFGLARDIYETDYYRKGDEATLPIRWMAPESIRDGIFTSNSDMWSYGVVLWEITTLAQMPYHPRTNKEVIKYVQTGQILDIPANTHEVLRPLMRHCWRWHASHRPRFAQVLKILDSYMDSDFRKVSFFHNGEDPNDTANVVPFRSAAQEDCYIYSDENDEINLYLGQSPSTAGTSSARASSSSSVKYSRFIPRRTNGHVENSVN